MSLLEKQGKRTNGVDGASGGTRLRCAQLFLLSAGLLHSVSVSADRYVRKSGAGSGRKIVERNAQYHESLFES